MSGIRAGTDFGKSQRLLQGYRASAGIGSSDVDVAHSRGLFEGDSSALASGLARIQSGFPLRGFAAANYCIRGMAGALSLVAHVTVGGVLAVFGLLDIEEAKA